MRFAARAIWQQVARFNAGERVGFRDEHVKRIWRFKIIEFVGRFEIVGHFEIIELVGRF